MVTVGMGVDNHDRFLSQCRYDSFQIAAAEAGVHQQRHIYTLKQENPDHVFLNPPSAFADFYNLIYVICH
jgi:hypothetical protein